jgi:uncharacterized protein
MTAPASFSVTEVVTASRCPRQLVLSRGGHRVTPHGGDAIGQAAHGALAALAEAAPRAAAGGPLGQALAAGKAGDQEAVAAACYGLAYPHTFRRALELAASVDGEALARLDAIVRNVARLLATLLVRARARGIDPARVVETVVIASEQEVSIEVELFRINGRIDLVCRDVETDETWLWDLKTYAGTDAAQDEQVRLYALASERAGLRTRPALLHVTGERVEIARVAPSDARHTEQLKVKLQDMSAWLSGTRPPPSTSDAKLCHACPAQDACWSRWGRTLDENGEPAAPGGGVPLVVAEAPARPTGRRRTLPPPLPGTRPAGEKVAAPVLREVPTPAPVGTAGARPPPGERGAVEEPAGEVPVDAIELSIGDLAGAPAAVWQVAPLWLGTTERGRAPARLELADLQKHVAVFGASGAGKTYFAKTFVEEAALAGVPVLVFDVQGDLAQLAQLAQLQSPLAPELAQRRERFAAGVEVRLFSPGSDAGLRVSLNPVRLPDPSFNEDERAFFLGTVADNLLGAVDVASSWRKRARGYLTQHLEAAVAEGGLLTLEQLIERLRDPGSLAAEPLLAKKAQREALVEQLRLLTVGTDRLLFQRGRPLVIEDLLRPTTPGKTPLNVVWLNALGDQAAKERFVGMVLSDLFAWALRNPSSTPQLLFYLDEVGPFMPPQGEPPSKAILKRLFKEGRKLGLCGLFCTQNFTDVDYKVFAQANTLAIGRINSNQDRDKARKLLQFPGFDADSAVERLRSAPAGRFLIRNPDRFPTPLWLQGRDLLTSHTTPWGEDEIRAHTDPTQRG